MFTGIVTALGRIIAREEGAELVRLTVASPYDAASVETGASVCHAGVCLTVVEHAPAPDGGMTHVVEAAAETLAITTVRDWQVGDTVNLERSLKAGDEFGGHFVQGHVDGAGAVLSVTQEGEGWRIVIRAPASLAGLIAPKGAITVDGVSLTVNGVTGDAFDVLIIPHTWAVTTLSQLQPGSSVNLEADMMARYVARILDARAALN
jgi:riboflavin synthase